MCFNKSVLHMAILLFCGILSYPILVATASLSERNSELPCSSALENQLHSENTRSIVRKCLKLFPLKDPNDSSSIEDSQRILDENQNNCALRCINENLNVTTKDGLVNVSKIQQQFLQNTDLTESYVLKLTEIMNDCEHRAGEELEAEGGPEQNICKYHVLFIHCYSEAYIASSQEINELCRDSKEPDKK